MGQLGGFSLAVHLVIILLSALFTGLEKMRGKIFSYFSWPKAFLKR